jgi:hypothetical protein
LTLFTIGETFCATSQSSAAGASIVFVGARSDAATLIHVSI